MGYRGEIKACFKNRDKNDVTPPYYIGDRICQIIIVPYPFVEFKEVDELEETVRGAGGYGSTGR